MKTGIIELNGFRPKNMRTIQSIRKKGKECFSFYNMFSDIFSRNLELLYILHDTRNHYSSEEGGEGKACEDYTCHQNFQLSKASKNFLEHIFGVEIP